VLENEWTALRDVTLETSAVMAKKFGPAADNFLRKTRAASLDRPADVRVVAICATHFSFQHWMVMREFKLRAHLQMTLETGIGRFSWIDDGVRAAAALDVQASRSMATLAAHLLRVVAGRL